MSIRAVVFDIGGVLELTPATGWEERWAANLALETGELIHRLEPTWRSGSLGKISLEEVEEQTAAVLGLEAAAIGNFMDDLWDEYLGTLNHELALYFATLRPRCRTGILSNSFVGAREKERESYDFRGHV